MMSAMMSAIMSAMFLSRNSIDKLDKPWTQTSMKFIWAFSIFETLVILVSYPISHFWKLTQFKAFEWKSKVSNVSKFQVFTRQECAELTQNKLKSVKDVESDRNGLKLVRNGFKMVWNEYFWRQIWVFRLTFTWFWAVYASKSGFQKCISF